MAGAGEWTEWRGGSWSETDNGQWNNGQWNNDDQDTQDWWQRTDDDQDPQDWWQTTDDRDWSGTGQRSTGSSAVRPKVKAKASVRPKIKAKAAASVRPKVKATAAAAASGKAKGRARGRNNRGDAQDKRELLRWRDDHAKRVRAEHAAEVLSDRLQQTEGEVWTLEIRNDLLQSQLQDEQERSRRRLSDVARTMSEKSALENDCVDLQSKLKVAEDQLKDLNEKFTGRGDQLDFFRCRCATQEDALKTTKKEASDLKWQVNQLEFDLKRSREENEAIRQDHFSYKAGLTMESVGSRLFGL